jgi:hypothetical protein
VIGENEHGLVLHNFEGKTYTYPNPARTAKRVQWQRRRIEVFDHVVA